VPTEKSKATVSPMPETPHDSEAREQGLPSIIRPAGSLCSDAVPNRLKRGRRISRLVADAKFLARLLGASVRSIRTWDAGGRLPRPIRIGGRTVWVLGGKWGIRAWLTAGAPARADWEAMKKSATIRK
jgi:hypothetical protein